MRLVSGLPHPKDYLLLSGVLLCTYLTYASGMALLLRGAPQAVVALVLIVEWAVAVALMNRLLPAELRRLVAFWFVLSPLTLLPLIVTTDLVLSLHPTTSLPDIVLLFALSTAAWSLTAKLSPRVGLGIASVASVSLFTFGAASPSLPILAASSAFALGVGLTTNSLVVNWANTRLAPQFGHKA